MDLNIAPVVGLHVLMVIAIYVIDDNDDDRMAVSSLEFYISNCVYRWMIIERFY